MRVRGAEYQTQHAMWRKGFCTCLQCVPPDFHWYGGKQNSNPRCCLFTSIVSYYWHCYKYRRSRRQQNYRPIVPLRMFRGYHKQWERSSSNLIISDLGGICLVTEVALSYHWHYRTLVGKTVVIHWAGRDQKTIWRCRIALDFQDPPRTWGICLFEGGGGFHLGPLSFL